MICNSIRDYITQIAEFWNKASDIPTVSWYCKEIIVFSRLVPDMVQLHLYSVQLLHILLCGSQENLYNYHMFTLTIEAADFILHNGKIKAP